MTGTISCSLVVRIQWQMKKTDYKRHFYSQDRVHRTRNGSISCQDTRNHKRDVFVDNKGVYCCCPPRDWCAGWGKRADPCENRPDRQAPGITKILSDSPVLGSDA
jgi:hypothetical protein